MERLGCLLKDHLPKELGMIVLDYFLDYKYVEMGTKLHCFVKDAKKMEKYTTYDLPFFFKSCFDIGHGKRIYVEYNIVSSKIHMIQTIPCYKKLWTKEVKACIISCLVIDKHRFMTTSRLTYIPEEYFLMNGNKDVYGVHLWSYNNNSIELIEDWEVPDRIGNMHLYDDMVWIPLCGNTGCLYTVDLSQTVLSTENFIRNGYLQKLIYGENDKLLLQYRVSDWIKNPYGEKSVLYLYSIKTLENVTNRLFEKEVVYIGNQMVVSGTQVFYISDTIKWICGINDYDKLLVMGDSIIALTNIDGTQILQLSFIDNKMSRVVLYEF